MGARLIINLEKLNLSLKKLELTSSNVNEYYEHSHNLGIPPIETQKLQNKIFGIECNFDKLNAIDFKKGCYVGQENTARINLKNKLNKRLFAIKIIEGIIEKNEITSIDDKEIGKLLINDRYPFAILKHKDENFNYNSELKCGSAKIKIKKFTVSINCKFICHTRYIVTYFCIFIKFIFKNIPILWHQVRLINK